GTDKGRSERIGRVQEDRELRPWIDWRCLWWDGCIPMVTFFRFRVSSFQRGTRNTQLETGPSNPQPCRNVRGLAAHLAATDGCGKQLRGIESAIGIKSFPHARHRLEVLFIEQKSYVRFLL